MQNKVTLAILLLFMFLGTYLSAEEAEDWMPDAALRAGIRENLSLPTEAALTKDRLQWIETLYLKGKGITDITGLEFAGNLRELHISQNSITDLGPLSHLGQLVELHFWHEEKQSINLDLGPLANLINLEVISIQRNGITDISALAGLKKLHHLHIIDNAISDVSPLANLMNLRRLWITGNPVSNIALLLNLNLTEFHYDAVCDIAPIARPAVQRIENRQFPSVSLWPAIGPVEYLSRYDNHWGHDEFGIESEISTTSIVMIGDIGQATTLHQKLLEINPNIIILFATFLYTAFEGDISPDSDMWLRDAAGERIYEVAWGGKEYQIDFTKPHVQDKIVERIVGIAACGIFDGIALDGFADNATAFVGRQLHPASNTEIIDATAHILREVRARVRDDFLIVVNGGRQKPTAYRQYVNGSFMEPGLDYPGGYTHAGLIELDSTLLWNAQHLRYPQINAAEGFLIENQSIDSPDNLRWSRVFTTRALTLSNGYVSIHHETTHARGESELWYDFWDAPLGQPVGGYETMGQLYENTEGLFIREFTNGWAVYNRSGKTQEIQLPMIVTGVESSIMSKTHTLPDLDGEIYLKSESGLENPPTADVNADGVVNVLDLVLVANALGEKSPDLNGDGIVNILDLVTVATQFNKQ